MTKTQPVPLTGIDSMEGLKLVVAPRDDENTNAISLVRSVNELFPSPRAAAFTAPYSVITGTANTYDVALVAYIGGQEAIQQQVTIRDMFKREQQQIPTDNVLDYLVDKIRQYDV